MKADRIGKTKIQLVREMLEYKQTFKERLNDLMEKYNVEDGVFVMVEGLKEVTTGYFEINGIYDNLDEAMTDMRPDMGMNAVRITDNKKFQIGIVKETLSSCNKEIGVLDIKLLKDVR